MASDVHEIVPDGVDADVIKQRVYGPGTTPEDEMARCPKCNRTTILRTGVGLSTRAESKYYCKQQDCKHHFDEPVTEVSDE